LLIVLAIIKILGKALQELLCIQILSINL